MPSKPLHVSLDDLPRVRAARGEGSLEEAAVVTDGSIMMFRWVEPQQGRMSAHQASGGQEPDRHPFDQTVLVLKGTVEITLGDEPYVVGPHQLLYIPANVPHTGRPLGDEPVLALELFAPVREDYLHLAAHQLDAE